MTRPTALITPPLRTCRRVIFFILLCLSLKSDGLLLLLLVLLTNQLTLFTYLYIWEFQRRNFDMEVGSKTDKGHFLENRCVRRLKDKSTPISPCGPYGSYACILVMRPSAVSKMNTCGKLSFIPRVMTWCVAVSTAAHCPFSDSQ